MMNLCFMHAAKCRGEIETSYSKENDGSKYLGS